MGLGLVILSTAQVIIFSCVKAHGFNFILCIPLDDDDDDCEKSLKAPANGSIVGACNKNYGSVCVFKCNTGFDLVGSAQVYCLGQWTTSEPTCVKAGATNATVKCSALNPPANGYLDGRCYQGSPVGSVCNFVCSTGYTLVGSSSSICLANGQWSAWAPSCNKPSTTKAPDNNSQNPFTFPAQTTSKPTWPSQPSQQTTVSPGKCSSVKDVENGRLKGDCQPGIKTRTCSVVCRFGYYADGGSKSITCQENGQWSGKLSSCKRK